MSKLADYKEFKKYQPYYKDWKSNRDSQNAKKVAYLKTNPISEDEFKKDIERAKIVLNAVNTMDEYSQAKAEEMENLTTVVTCLGSEIPLMVGSGLAGLYFKVSKAGRAALSNLDFKNIKTLAKLAPAVILITVPSLVLNAITSFWSAKKQVEASKLGRTEAMANDLSSLSQFAVLNEEQKQEVEKIADTIQVEKNEAKKASDASQGTGFVSSLKTLLAPDNKLIAKQNEYNTKFKKQADNAADLKLSAEEELLAKKDQDLIQNIVEKIDIASQDYAENAELATNLIPMVALGVLGGSSVVINKLLSKIPFLAKKSKTISTAIGLISFIGLTVASTKIQMEASRVGRYKAKNELLNNPEQFVYVDKEKYAQMQGEASKKNGKNFFANLIQLYNDNKEYNEYIEANSAREVQLRKARNQIKLTPEQINEAQRLQNNTFKMFNKLDEKSQQFSESTEALGEVANQSISLLSTIPAMLIALSKGKKGSGFISTTTTTMLSLIPSILLEIFITKEQRNACRVANMQAIKELDDYKHFAYKDSNSIDTKETKNQSLNFEAKTYPALSNASKKMLERMRSQKAI